MWGWSKLHESLEGREATARPIQGLLQPYWCIGWAGGEDLKMRVGSTLGTEEAGIYKSFSGIPNYYKEFYI